MPREGHFSCLWPLQHTAYARFVRPHAMILPPIHAAFQPLHGLPMWAAGWADIAWFQFGAQVKRTARGDGERPVGAFALHISCPWRWCTSSGFVRADDTSDPAALQALGDPTCRLAGAATGPNETIILKFDNGDTLEVDSVRETAPDEVEYWRLLQPGLRTPHFVVSSSGAEWHEA